MTTTLPRELVDWVNREFPRPRVDPSLSTSSGTCSSPYLYLAHGLKQRTKRNKQPPWIWLKEWLEQCYEWLISDANLQPTTADGLQAIKDGIYTQLIQSDLVDSMLHGTGLPPNISQPGTSTTLTGQPVLVQIVSMTDIGVGAYNLNQTRVVREERIKAGGTPGEDEEQADEDVLGEGPVPKYQRSMLKLELSDGVTTMRAIEYRALPDLTLGVTPIGYKMLIKDVMVRRGIAFLEPKCVVMKGPPSVTPESEARHAMEFARSLRRRLGLPEPAEAPGAPAPAPLAQVPAPPVQQQIAPPITRPPLRTIPRPPSPPLLQTNSTLNGDEDQPRRRRVPNNSSYAISSGTTLVASPSRSNSNNVVGLTRNTPTVDLTQDLADDSGMPLFYSGNSTDEEREFYEQLGGPSSSPTKSKGKLKPKKPSIIDVDAIMDEVNQPQASSSRQPPPLAHRNPRNPKGSKKQRQPGDDHTELPTSDYGSEPDLSTTFYDELDRAEEVALQSMATSQPTSSAVQREGITAANTALNAVTGSGHASVSVETQAQTASSSTLHESSSGNPPRRLGQEWSVITISDNEDNEDKENTPPPSRNVRRRTENNGGGRGQPQSQQPGGSQWSQISSRTGKPIVMADNSRDIIDLSDSD
ncbi:hypothetical protein AX16_003855 [Volvariella volvacea WC 439]|nr:hypothetical protein AX16_003855 [Volvariella volvacea WC 439]